MLILQYRGSKGGHSDGHIGCCSIHWLISAVMFFTIFLLSTFGAHSMAVEKPRMHILTAKEKDDIVKTHNKARRHLVKQGYVVPDLTWDEDLAKFAHYYIKNSIDHKGQCPQGHNPNRCWYHGLMVDGVGENIASNSQPFINESIDMWIDERKDYSYGRLLKKSDNEPVTGHYTQLVWGRTRKVGCAIGINCWDSGTFFKIMLICNYWPSGNFMNQFPYYKTAKPDDWKIFDYPLFDTCRDKEKEKGNWDTKKNKLKKKVPQPYHKFNFRPGKTLYDELAPDDLMEMICNIIKYQSLDKLKSYGIDSFKKSCSKMGRKPIKKKLSGSVIMKKVCGHVYRLVKKEKTDYHTSMAGYCDFVLKNKSG